MRVLVIAPHPDDEILGCGGTMAKRSKKGDEVYVCIITKGYEPNYTKKEIEKTRKEDKIANDILGTKKIYYLDVPTMNFENVNKGKLSNDIKSIIDEVKPEEVYIPFHEDIHEEHKIISSCSLVALRPKYNNCKRIYEYETLSETGWDFTTQEKQFIPNTFENIDKTLKAKIKALKKIKSQIEKYPNTRSVENIEYQARYRGAILGKEKIEAFILVREIKE